MLRAVFLSGDLSPLETGTLLLTALERKRLTSSCRSYSPRLNTSLQTMGRISWMMVVIFGWYWCLLFCIGDPELSGSSLPEENCPSGSSEEAASGSALPVKLVISSLFFSINRLKGALAIPNGDPEHDRSDVFMKEKALLNWLKGMSVAKLFDWFDAVQETTVDSAMGKARWRTETIERDRLFLTRLGVLKP